MWSNFIIAHFTGTGRSFLINPHDDHLTLEVFPARLNIKTVVVAKCHRQSGGLQKNLGFKQGTILNEIE